MVAAGVGNVILPGLVKLYAPNSIGTMTAAYGMALAVSSSAPSFFGLWMADAAGWRVSLGAWAAISLVGIVPWLWVVSHAKMRGVSEAEIAAALPVSPPLVSMSHSPTAVAIMIIFGVSGVMAYSWFALLPQAMMELGGLSVECAALALGIFTIMGFPLSLTIPHLASRSGWPGALVGIAVTCGLSGMLGLLLAPTLAPFLWAVLLGLGPLTFPLSLALIGYRTKNHLTALVLSGYVNKLGYLLAAAGPLVVGFVLQATGTWTLSIMFLMVVTLLEIPAIWVLAKERIVDDELAEHGLSAHMSS
jgi:CP family cyanate transporter-like MFS transporter